MATPKKRHLRNNGYSKSTSYITTGGAGYVPPVSSQDYIDRGLYKVSSTIMALGRGVRNHGLTSKDNKEPIDGIAQGTYLLPKQVQQRVFEKYGYKRNDGDYGLVKRAIGNRNIPVYQKNSDTINRENLIVIGNPKGTAWYGKPGKELMHAGYYPSAVYHDNDGNLYQKAWDLNDYGIDENGNAGAAKHYSPLKKMLANIVDAVGSPTVVTTGYQKIINRDGSHATLLNNDNEELNELITDYLNSKGLVKYEPQLATYEELERGLPIISPGFIGIPEVTIIGKRKKHKEGGSIHIAPSKRGTFTAAATKHHLGVQQFASKVLANKDKNIR